MRRTIESLKKDLDTVSVGRAVPSLLDSIKVDSYGSITPLNRISNITVADSNVLFVQVWDRGLLSVVEKAIQNANLGFNPQVEANGIRIIVPKLSEERRKELCKIVKRYGEDKKISLRNERKNANESLKKLKGTISEDQIKECENRVQKITDRYSQKVDEMAEEKNKLLMTY